MKTLIISISVIIILFGCKRDWDHPLFSDKDLVNTPNILQIDLDSDNNANIILDYAYSDSSIIVLERNSIGGFETINFIRKSQLILIDTSFDKEIDHEFIYRIYVTKGKYRSPKSEEEPFDYISLGLKKPEDITTESEELQGINLFWKDKSNHEENYKIEKDVGSGFYEIASLSANSESYFDAISGILDPPLQITYRIKASNSTKESDWTDISINYAGLGSPSDLQITNTSSANLKIEWQDNSQIETGYSIERKKDDGGYSEIATVGSDISFFSDLISETGVYHYKVRSFNDAAYSSFSNEVSQEITSLIPIDGLVAYYPFNGNANDESGNGNGGIVSGATLVADRFNNQNSAYIFDGIDDYIEILHDNSLNSNEGSFSIQAVFKTDINLLENGSPTGSNTLISKNQFDFGNGYFLGFNWAEKKIIIMISDKPNINHKVRFSFNESTNYHHLFYIYDKTIDSLKLYLDGEFSSGISTNCQSINPPSSLFFGKYHQVAWGYHFYKGIIDDIRIYNRALSEEEIQTLYHEGGWDE